MELRHAVSTALLLTSALTGITACGSSGDGPPKEPRDEARAPAPSSVVRVGVGGPVRFDKKRYTAAAGAVRIEHTNPRRIGHNVRVQQADKPCCTKHDIGGTNTVSDGQTHGATIELARGQYTLYCSLGGHWQRGMKATLVVR